MLKDEKKSTFVIEALENYLENEEILKYKLLYRSTTGGNID
jgi:hypothetical protein